MSQRLIRAGHRVSMICGELDVATRLARDGKGVCETDVDGIRVFTIPERYSNQMGFIQRVRAFGRFARAATRVAVDTRADLVFASSTPLTVGIPGMKTGRRLGIPFVFEVRDLWPDALVAMGALKNPAVIWYSKRLERRIYASAERIIVLSPGMKEGVCSNGIPAERVSMIPNGSDIDLFTPTDEPLDDARFGAPDDFRLTFTGAHGRANGLDAVLDAAVELKKRGVRGIRFVFIGSGALKEALRRRSREQGVEAHVCWVDSIPKAELARVLPRMNVGMAILANVPAFYYGTSPNKFFDYIASGIPVLNNYPGWLTDMINENRCGKAVPPADPVAFADAAVWMRDHPEELKEMGRRGRALAEREFARDRLAEQFLRTIEDAHASFGRRR